MNMREEICRKLRETVQEVGQDRITPAIILGPWDLNSPVGGHQYLVAPTLGEATLANTDWKTARVFEEA
jgi:hypothetical protein